MPYNTAAWVGAEYTPWNASNELWWINYDRYRPTVDRELGLLKEQFGFTALRVWLHTMLHAHDAAALKHNVSDFLALADSHGFGVGLVLFDDCWNKAGANLTAPCVARKGVHNGCWMRSPQAFERTSVSRFEPYVRDVVSAFGRDRRVLWFETYKCVPRPRRRWASPERSRPTNCRSCQRSGGSTTGLSLALSQRPVLASLAWQRAIAPRQLLARAAPGGVRVGQGVRADAARRRVLGRLGRHGA